MTTDELMTEVRILLGDETATVHRSTRILSVLNACLQTLWFLALKARPDHGETAANLSTVLNQDRITLPSDFLEPLRLEHATDQAELTKWDWPEDERLLDPEKPWEYRIEGASLIFRAPANAVHPLTLYYRKGTPKLVNDGDIHGLPSYFDQVLVERTAKKLGAQLDVDELRRDEQAALNQFTRARTTTVGYFVEHRTRGRRVR